MYILCGTPPAEIPAGNVVVVDPSQHFSLREKGLNRAILLNDYCDQGINGLEGDHLFWGGLERALLDESRLNPTMRWAPLAYLLIQLRIARFITLRRALTNILAAFSPNSLTVSSNEDADLVNAVKSAGARMGLTVTVLNGQAIRPTSMIFRLTPFSIPLTRQPLWLTAFVAFARKLVFGHRHILTDAPWQLLAGRARIDHIRLNFHIGLVGAILGKFGRRQDAQLMLERDIDHRQSNLELRSQKWAEFTDQDALDQIRQILDYFFRVYPPSSLDKAYASILIYLRTAAPAMVILSHDKIDLFRLIFHACRELGIPSAYQPHGIVFEDYSGERNGSPFEPEYILPWVPASAACYQNQGWPTVVTSFRGLQFPARAYRPLTGNPSQWRVLCLLPDWICATQQGREDCIVRDLFEVVEGLELCGVPLAATAFKYHKGPVANELVKAEALTRAEEVLRKPLNVLPPDTISRNILNQYDVVIMPVTSGIYEAALLGVPLVIFGLPVSRVGALKEAKLPYANNAQQLADSLLGYRNQLTEEAYRMIAVSLQTDVGADAVLKSLESGH